jgi:hypothetical protein
MCRAQCTGNKRSGVAIERYILDNLVFTRGKIADRIRNPVVIRNDNTADDIPED